MELSLSKIFYGIMAVFVAIVTLGSFYTVPSGTVVVEDVWGKYKDTVETAGMNWKKPFVEDITRFDVKVIAANYHGAADAEDVDGVINKPYLDVPDSKNVPFYIEMTVTYQPVADKVPFILTQYGDAYFEKIINPRIRDVVRDVGGKYSVETVANHREAINTEINTRLAEEFKELPFIFDRANLRAILLPQAIQAAINGVQAAKQEEERLKVVAAQAEQTKRATIVAAEAIQQKAIIEAEGNAKAILSVATAQATANQKLGASLTPLLVQSQQIAKWQGTVPMVSNDKTGLLLDVRNLKGD